MAYDHSRKIGNQGDVVKHSALYNCVMHLIERSTPSERFIYAESHCGRASYILPEGGEWGRGVRLLASKPRDARGRHPRIDAYFQAALSSRVCIGQQFYGSSNIAFRCLRSNDRDFDFVLFETDVHAYDDLVRFYTPWMGNVELCNRDGYAGLENLAIRGRPASASLVLVDPPRLEPAEIASCLGHLKGKRIPYVCWTPGTRPAVVTGTRPLPTGSSASGPTWGSTSRSGGPSRPERLSRRSGAA